jgi:hypothetical protein
LCCAALTKKEPHREADPKTRRPADGRCRPVALDYARESMNPQDFTAVLAGLLAVLPFLLLLLWRKHVPGLNGMVDFNTVPPFRGWAAKPHPDAAVPVRTGRRLSDEHDSVNAHVIVRTAWGRYPGKGEGPGWRVARPLTPVVYVDGIPASSGWGTTRLTLAPGRHLIAVTGSHSRCYQELDLARGDRRELDYRCVIGPNAHQYHENELGLNLATYLTERSRGLDTFRGAGNGVKWTAYGAIALALLLTAVLLLLPEDGLVPVGDLLVVPLLVIPAMAGVGLAVFAVAQAFRKPPVIAADPPPHGSSHELRVLDDDEPAALTPAPGWAALGLHLRFWLEEHDAETLRALAGGKPSLLQRWRTVRVGEPEAPAVRPWVPAPEVRVDGRVVDASWTRLWMQLPPGEHEVSVRVRAPHSQIGPQTEVDLGRAQWRRRVFLTAGMSTDLDVLARVTAVPRPDRPELAAFRARV